MYTVMKTIDNQAFSNVSSGAGYPPKRVILLGAGAAQIYGGSTTDDLTNEILQIPIAKTLYDAMNIHNKYRPINFEDVIGAIELLRLYQKSADSKVFYRHPIFAFFKRKCRFNYSEAELKEAYKECIETIVSSIRGYSTNEIVENESSLIQLQYYANPKWRNKIYSLNYDRVPLYLLKQSGKSVYEGVNSKGLYEYDLMKFVRAECTFFNLHGSVYHKGNPWSEQVYLLDEPRQITGLSIWNDDSYFFTPVLTGKNKEQKFLNQPFLFGNAALALDLNEADRIDIIGYSLGDTHLNNAIQYFKATGVEMNIVGYEKSLSDYDPIKEMSRLEEVKSDLCVLLRTQECRLERKNSYTYTYSTKDVKVNYYPCGFNDYLNLEES